MSVIVIFFMTMYLIGSAVVFTTGLVVGSFLNVVILRGVRGEEMTGRSRCEGCRKTLGAVELIPVLSYIIQKGQCRSCLAPLSLQYPLVELGTAVSYLMVARYFWPGILRPDISIFEYLEFLAGLTVVSAAVVILVSDLRFQIIPNGAVLALLIVNVARVPLVGDFISALATALFLGSLWFFSGGRWMGLGDAKLIFATSLLIGFPASLSAVLFSFWLGGGAGILLLVLGAQNLRSSIPFGPFILAGTALAFFFSDQFLIFTGLDLLL